MMSVRLVVAAMACCMALPAAARGIFDLPDLEAEPENHRCPSAPTRPDWIARPEENGLTRSQLATELYKQEGYRNVVEAGGCTCELRFPSWDNVTSIIESDFAEITRYEFLEIIPDIRRVTKAYRREGRPICRDAGLW